MTTRQGAMKIFEGNNESLHSECYADSHLLLVELIAECLQLLDVAKY